METVNPETGEVGEAPAERVGATCATSPTIGALAAALAKAQALIEPAEKTKKADLGRGGQYRYATLDGIWESCRGPLSANGLSVMQPVATFGCTVVVTTLLAHSSGEWIRSDLTMTCGRPGPQEQGSAITYGRKYGLASMVGVAQEDDDARQAQPATNGVPSPAAANGNGQPANGAPTKADLLFDSLKEKRQQLHDRQATPEEIDAWVSEVRQARHSGRIPGRFEALREFHSELKATEGNGHAPADGK